VGDGEHADDAVGVTCDVTQTHSKHTTTTAAAAVSPCLCLLFVHWITAQQATLEHCSLDVTSWPPPRCCWYAVGTLLVVLLLAGINVPASLASSPNHKSTHPTRVAPL